MFPNSILWLIAIFQYSFVVMEEQEIDVIGDVSSLSIEEMPTKYFVNFASIDAGAVIMETSPTAEGYINILNDFVDKYGIAPCNDKKFVVIGLSEDIMVRTVILSTFEKYSSNIKEFQVLGSVEYPSSTWIDLGSFTAINSKGEQTFHLPKSYLTRFLKVRFISHFGSEFYCTLTQIKVFGDTVIQDLRQAVKISEANMIHDAEIIQKGMEEKIAVTIDDVSVKLEEQAEDEPEVTHHIIDDVNNLNPMLVDDILVINLMDQSPSQVMVELKEDAAVQSEAVIEVPDTGISCNNLLSLSEFREKMSKLLKTSSFNNNNDLGDLNAESSVFRAVILKVASLELSLTLHEQYINYLKKCLEDRLTEI